MTKEELRDLYDKYVENRDNTILRIMDFIQSTPEGEDEWCRVDMRTRLYTRLIKNTRYNEYYTLLSYKETYPNSILEYDLDTLLTLIGIANPPCRVYGMGGSYAVYF